MSKITEVLRLKHVAGLPYAHIARAVGLSQGAVSKYVTLATAAGVNCWPLPDGVDEAALERRLFPSPGQSPSKFVEPDWFEVHQELKRKGVTLQRLWSEHVERVGDRAHRYTQFSQHYRAWRARQKRSMRQHHRAGEKLFIDHCGPTVPVIDRNTGEVRTAQVFVAVLGASSYTYAEATWTQGLEDWIGSNRRMLEFYGGVPQLLIIDYVARHIIDVMLRSPLCGPKRRCPSSKRRCPRPRPHNDHSDLSQPSRAGSSRHRELPRRVCASAPSSAHASSASAFILSVISA